MSEKPVSNKVKKRNNTLLLTVVVLSIITAMVFVVVFANSNQYGIEPTNLSVATLENDTQASGGSFILFKENSPNPPPTTTGCKIYKDQNVISNNCPSGFVKPLTINGDVKLARASINSSNRPTVAILNYDGTVNNDFLDISPDGGEGEINVNAGAGDDYIIIDGARNIKVTGGPGADIFVLNRGAWKVNIFDFNLAEGDRIYTLKTNIPYYTNFSEYINIQNSTGNSLSNKAFTWFPEPFNGNCNDVRFKPADKGLLIMNQPDTTALIEGDTNCTNWLTNTKFNTCLPNGIATQLAWTEFTLNFNPTNWRTNELIPKVSAPQCPTYDLGRKSEFNYRW